MVFYSIIFTSHTFIAVVYFEHSWLCPNVTQNTKSTIFFTPSSFRYKCGSHWTGPYSHCCGVCWSEVYLGHWTHLGVFGMQKTKELICFLLLFCLPYHIVLMLHLLIGNTGSMCGHIWIFKTFPSILHPSEWTHISIPCFQPWRGCWTHRRVCTHNFLTHSWLHWLSQNSMIFMLSVNSAHSKSALEFRTAG